MTAEQPPAQWARQMLRVWFETLDSADWFRSSPQVDAMLRDRFGAELERQGACPATAFTGDSRTALAAILLFDQVPRNIFRDSARAYAFDPLAVALAHQVVERDWLAGYRKAEKQFALMPLMHSEALADQELCLALFAAHVPDAYEFAQSHHKMIARFGRFPHRNAVLGRKTTPAEAEAIAAGFSW